VLIGTAVDELIRHHPMLKLAVFQSLKSTLSKVEHLGNAFEAKGELAQWYKLSTMEESAIADDAMRMEDVQISDPYAPRASGEPSGVQRNDSATSSGGDDQNLRSHDNTVVSFIDVLGRVNSSLISLSNLTYICIVQFLEGLFQHPPHVKDFIALADGLECIGRFTALPCLPYDFANSVASDSLVQVMRTMTEASTSQTLLHLSSLVKASLAETEYFWGSFEESSKLMPLLEIESQSSLTCY
jgi:E3 ubiquitin-protein ligase HUWE1